MREYGIFSDDSADYTVAEAIEAGFYSFEEAATALAEQYSDEDNLVIREIEEEEGDDDEL